MSIKKLDGMYSKIKKMDRNRNRMKKLHEKSKPVYDRTRNDTISMND